MLHFYVQLVAAYTIWYLVSRMMLIAAGLMARPKTLRFRHYVFLGLSLMPFVAEALSTMTVAMSIATNINLSKSYQKSSSDTVIRDIIEAE